MPAVNPIHIPAEYMEWSAASSKILGTTGFNADNVSGHHLRRVCEEVGVPWCCPLERVTCPAHTKHTDKCLASLLPRTHLSGGLSPTRWSKIKILRCEYPDRLTMASTGGPLTGDHESNARDWQYNTKCLEAAGAMGIEYSLSCPQVCWGNASGVPRAWRWTTCLRAVPFSAPARSRVGMGVRVPLLRRVRPSRPGSSTGS